MSSHDRIQTAVILGRYSEQLLNSYRAATAIAKLYRIAATLSRLNTDACNVPVETCPCCNDERIRVSAKQMRERGHVPSKCHYARVESLEARARAIGTELGVVITTQRDPRGACVKLWADKEDGRSLGCL